VFKKGKEGRFNSYKKSCVHKWNKNVFVAELIVIFQEFLAS